MKVDNRTLYYKYVSLHATLIDLYLDADTYLSDSFRSAVDEELERVLKVLRNLDKEYRK
jgi:hypothetical protein